MITTKQYIFNEGLFEPSIYRNHKFSKIIKYVKGQSLDPYISQISYFNSRGQIERIERVNGSWMAYLIDHKTEKPTMDVVDFLEYNENDQITLITTKFINDQSEEIETKIFEYNSGELSVIKKSKFSKGISYLTQSIFKYENHKLSREESRNEIGGELRMLNVIDYRWNIENQIIGKEQESTIFYNNQENLVTIESVTYSYKNHQLELEKKQLEVDNNFATTTTKFKYSNALSDQIRNVKQYNEHKQISSIEYSMDENNKISIEYMGPDGNESLIEFHGTI